MRTTVRLSDDLLKRARKRAAEDGRTLTSLIEEGLTLVLAPKSTQREYVELPVSKATGGVLPGVDINRSSVLEAVMDSTNKTCGLFVQDDQTFWLSMFLYRVNRRMRKKCQHSIEYGQNYTTPSHPN